MYNYEEEGIINFFALGLALCMVSADARVYAAGIVNAESSVTDEMCAASYWQNLYGAGKDNVLMDANAIKKFNDTALKSEDASMNDLLAMLGVEQTT